MATEKNATMPHFHVQWNLSDVHQCNFSSSEAGPLPTTIIPFVCSGVPYGTAAWYGVLCWPFWSFTPLRLLLAFCALVLLRYIARNELHLKEYKLNEPNTDTPDPHSPHNAGASRNLSRWRGEMEAPLLKESEREHGRIHFCSYLCRIFGRCIKVLVFCLGDITICMLRCTGSYVWRIVLQIFQWWALMFFLMLWTLYFEVQKYQHKFQIEIDWSAVKHRQLSNIFVKNTHIKDLQPWVWTVVSYSFLAFIAICAISLLLVLSQLVAHMGEQLCRCNIMLKKGAVLVSLPRDVAIQVILLPLIYGFCAVKSVCCILEKMSGQFDDALECWGWDLLQKQKIKDDEYDCNFALADLYEAWALLCFGQLVSKVMHPELTKKIRLDVFQAFEHLLLIDVGIFVVICFVSALLTLVLTWSKWRLGYDLCHVLPFLCSFYSYLGGANWCVASVAIYNLWSIEHKFAGLTTMQNFDPFPKFWSIKIMVLVAFWNVLLTAVIRDFWDLQENATKILDACIRIYVMAGVSVINLYAWWPFKRWYAVVRKADRDLEADILQKKKDLEEGGKFGRAESSMKIGVKTEVPNGTKLMVAEILGITIDEAADWNFVSNKLNELTSDQLVKVLYHGSQFGWVFASQADTAQLKDRRPLLRMDHDERKMSLAKHLQSFYPED